MRRQFWLIEHDRRFTSLDNWASCGRSIEWKPVGPWVFASRIDDEATKRSAQTSYHGRYPVGCTVLKVQTMASSGIRPVCYWTVYRGRHRRGAGDRWPALMMIDGQPPYARNPMINLISPLLMARVAMTVLDHIVFHAVVRHATR